MWCWCRVGGLGEGEGGGWAHSCYNMEMAGIGWVGRGGVCEAVEIQKGSESIEGNDIHDMNWMGGYLISKVKTLACNAKAS